jgi:hypothetical protein
VAARASALLVRRALMTLRASPSRACPRVSRSRSLAGVRPGLAGRSVAPPACTEGSAPCAPPSPRASPCWRMRDAELSTCWTAACSMSACALWCRFRASGVEGAGMARSSIVAAMSFWLARGGVSGLSTLKSALMRSRACMPSSRTRTVRYSSASLASCSWAWASCVLMSAPAGGEGAGALGPAARREAIPGAGVTSPSSAPAAPVAFAGSLAMTMQHSRAGS